VSDTLPPEDHRTKQRLPELLNAQRGIREHGGLHPHAGPMETEQSPNLGKSGTLRAAIFGINDGLVSNVALIMGFAGAAQSRSVILLAGISGLLAGAFSMGAGEYVSMRVQREVLERILHLEAHELASDPEGERVELAYLYRQKGLSSELADAVATELMRDPDVALDTHAREELGIDPDEGLGSPWGAATSSFLTFSVGAFVPLAPFIVGSGVAAKVASAIVAGVALLVVGGLTSHLTGRSLTRSAFRMCGVGVSAALITYGVGAAVGTTVG
jgi:VIT1/CCC1 family predicted Fe2+/Mn2+ transporter